MPNSLRPIAEVEPSARVRYEAAVRAGAIIPEGNSWHLSEEEIKRRKLRPCDREEK